MSKSSQLKIKKNSLLEENYYIFLKLTDEVIDFQILTKNFYCPSKLAI